ncbi:hypothetical protein DL93DRAFT_2222689 [Clavulina sp. PMI_390]|nr:hypothetical protein DL93DRAFT_2222689 [Clavulina sp. PMI_390]
MSTADIAGNVSDADKQHIVRVMKVISEAHRDRWAFRLMDELKPVSVDRKPQVQGKKSDIVLVTETVVEEYMCNGWDIAHGGMISTLLDYVTSVPVSLLLKHDNSWATAGLSLSLDVNLLSPALKGDTLRCIGITKSGGKRTATVYGELWGPRGLVATATHVKMVPQTGPASKNHALSVSKL